MDLQHQLINVQIVLALSLLEVAEARKEADCMSSLSIKCSVDNCKYNSANECHAPTLSINAFGDGYAFTSDGTQCATFVPKDTEK